MNQKQQQQHKAQGRDFNASARLVKTAAYVRLGVKPIALVNGKIRYLSVQ